MTWTTWTTSRRSSSEVGGTNQRDPDDDRARNAHTGYRVPDSFDDSDEDVQVEVLDDAGGSSPGGPGRRRAAAEADRRQTGSRPRGCRARDGRGGGGRRGRGDDAVDDDDEKRPGFDDDERRRRRQRQRQQAQTARTRPSSTRRAGAPRLAERQTVQPGVTRAPFRAPDPRGRLARG